MASLALHFLGVPHIVLDDVNCALKLKKALALLAVVATSSEAQTRSTLAALLWPETQAARQHLRYALWTLRQELGTEWLLLEDDRVALNAEADVQVDTSLFQSLLGRAGLPVLPDGFPSEESIHCLEEAVNLYRDDFLLGFTLRDCADFDTWQTLHTEIYRRELLLALEALVTGLTSQMRHEWAVSYAQRWAALDPLNEPAHRSLMRLYVHTGHRAEAIRQYDACAQNLRRELGVDPGPRTSSLYHAILERRFLASA